MSYYENIYKKRLGRHGETAGERLEKGRQKNFERFLNTSPHYVSFMHKKNTGLLEEVEAVLEPYRQNQTQTLMYLLTRVSDRFEIGEVITIQHNDLSERYMVYEWHERRDSGYNRWMLVKLNYKITWVNQDGQEYTSDAYIYSQEDNMLKNELKSRSRSATLYLENLKLDFMLMPAHPQMKINSYLEIELMGIKRAERVTGFDFMSTPGVMYISMDPTFERDLTPMPERKPGDEDSDFFWGGDFSE